MKRFIVTLLAPVLLALAVASGVAHATTEPNETSATAIASSAPATPAEADAATQQDSPDTGLIHGSHVQHMVGVHAHGFCYNYNPDGTVDPQLFKQQLIDLNVEALKKDPSGNARLDPKVCGAGRATPRNYLESFQHHDKAAELTSAAQIPAYLAKLVVDCNPPRDVVWNTDAIEDNGATYIDFMARDFGTRECGLKNPTTGKFVIFFRCANPIGEVYVPPNLPEVVLTTAKPKPPVDCYTVPMDYRNQPDVTVDADGSARVVVHLNLSDEEYQRMIKDPCFGIISEDHPAWNMLQPDQLRCDGCVVGEYPPMQLATQVGLPAEKPGHTYAHRCGQKGQVVCVASYPKWAVVHITDLVYCVDVHNYPIKVMHFYEFYASDRFNVVYTDEIVRTAPSGKLDRTLRGENHFTVIAPGERSQ